uniref:Uncharacterized protein n=1 Tax=Acrobeloides nanus TaxID=290746 RepID=A0A914DZC1_9BILA
MKEDKGRKTFDNSGRRLAGLSATATGPVDQDKKNDYPTADREGRMQFVEGKAHPDDEGAKTNEMRADY